MAQQLYGIEKGIRISKSNSDTEFIDILFGSSVPGGDAGEQDAAPLGSWYYQQNGANSKAFQKQFNTGAASDWQENAATAAVIGVWRSEKISVVTNDTQAVGTRDIGTTPFADDEAPLLVAADFVIGEFVIVDADGAPALLEITNKVGNVITFAAASTPLANDNTFVTRNYLPDSPGDQEGKAIVNYNGSIIVKLSDIDWNFADGISLNGAVNDNNGAILGSDTIQVALEKHEGDIKDAHTALGIVRGAINFGTFVGSLIADNLNAKAIFQRIEDILMELRGTKVTGITAVTAVASFPHANIKSVKYFVELFEEATPANRKAGEVFILTDGTTVDFNKTSKLKIGGNFNAIATIVINGANVELRFSSSTAGITVTTRRIEVISS